MKRFASPKPVVPFRVLLLAGVPFAVPVLLTLVFLVTFGSGLARDIAPGSGLKLAGLLATLITTLGAWLIGVRGLGDGRVRILAGVMCLLIGLISWPVWSMAVLPFINALALHGERTIVMTLDRTEATSIKNSPDKNHWAWLTPISAATGVIPGHHFIPKATYDLWALEEPATVDVLAATGLLGATVIVDIRLP